MPAVAACGVFFSVAVLKRRLLPISHGEVYCERVSCMCSCVLIA
jgi:hypothetical protein